MHKLAPLALLLAASATLAASVHLKPPHRNPTFADNGLFLSIGGSLAGLGNGDIVITLAAQGTATATCTNPSGQNQPPGQNPAPVSLIGTQIIPEDAFKNGNVSFNVQTTAPVTPVPGAPDCPNANWTEQITDVKFTSATLTVQQPAGVTVLTVACTFSPPTGNGAVPTGTVACTNN